MSREDIHETYEMGNTEVIELGVDHNGNPQWYYSTDEGWVEAGENNVLVMNAEHFKVGTRIELTNPSCEVCDNV